MEKFMVLHKTSGEKRRCVIESSGNYFVFSKGCSKQGLRYTPEQFEQFYIALVQDPSKFETEKWHDRLNKAIRKMEASCVWPDIARRYKKLLAMTWEEHEEISSAGTYGNEEDKKEVVKKYGVKYPFAFVGDRILMDYFDTLSICKLKTIYFGKSKNAEIKASIKNAIEAKTSYKSLLVRGNYDVSFDYDPKTKRAVYSEEYKRSGNGHYYLALDANTAVFCEDD